MAKSKQSENVDKKKQRGVVPDVMTLTFRRDGMDWRVEQDGVQVSRRDSLLSAFADALKTLAGREPMPDIVSSFRRRVRPTLGCTNCRAASLAFPQACKDHSLEAAVRRLNRARRAS